MPLHDTWKLFIKITTAIDVLSASLAGLSLVFLFTLRIFDAKMVNRTSLRLTAAIALIDIVNHINSAVHWDIGEGNVCVFSAFLRIFGRQAYCFLNISIALNLHLILLGGLRPKAWWEKYYWLLSLLVPLAMNLPPLLLGMYGFNGGRCFIRPIKEYKALKAINILLITSITFVYCTLISVLVIVRLRVKLAIVRNLNPNLNYLDAFYQHKIEQSHRKLISRISLYPAVCVASTTFYFFYNLWNTFIGNNQTLLAFSMFGLTLTGILNFVAFMLDPTLQAAAKSMYSSLKSTYSASESPIQLLSGFYEETHHQIHDDNNTKLL